MVASSPRTSIGGKGSKPSSPPLSHASCVSADSISPPLTNLLPRLLRLPRPRKLVNVNQRGFLRVELIAKHARRRAPGGPRLVAETSSTRTLALARKAHARINCCCRCIAAAPHDVSVPHKQKHRVGVGSRPVAEKKKALLSPYNLKAVLPPLARSLRLSTRSASVRIHLSVASLRGASFPRYP
eukprot:scaffold16765_cov103-Isochrysis_galbana.AAC.1